MLGAFPKLRSGGPADWGVGMTLCVAAVCNERKSIVAVSDRAVSLGYFSTDAGTIKIEPISVRWMAMFAARDFTPVPFIIERVRKKFAGAETKSFLEVTDISARLPKV
jgi:hypothetical protein